MKKATSFYFAALVVLLFCTANIGFTQSSSPKYVSIAYIKSKSPDFITKQTEQWLPVHQELIKNGKKTAWYMYRVKYPTGSKVNYDYVRFDVFTDWKQAEDPYAGLAEVIKKVHPDLDMEGFVRKTDQFCEIVWEQLHQVIDEATTPPVPSQFIVVNEVRSVPGGESEYVKMEITYFKPFHAERVRRGLMNNWSLFKPALPYGTKYDHDYVTLNGYQTWNDIVKNPPSDVWGKVHGNVNFNEIHSQILAKRITVNNELWELVAYAIE